MEGTIITMEVNSTAVVLEPFTNDTFMNSSNLSQMEYCGQGLANFSEGYKMMHGYVSLVVCIFGSVANSLNIAVLTRREMTSPTNALLTGLAVADLLVMLEYIPFAIHMYLPMSTSRPMTERYSYSWSAFVMFHSNFAQVCHTVSIWLTVTLAVWRYIAVAHPQRNPDWCSMKTTLAAIIFAYIVCPLLCIPLYLAFSVQPFNQTVNSDGYRVTNVTDPPDGARNVTLYHINLSDLETCASLSSSSSHFLIKLRAISSY